MRTPPWRVLGEFLRFPRTDRLNVEYRGYRDTLESFRVEHERLFSNTRITDPEILEYGHPSVRLEQFRMRPGGEGAYRGGDGVVREVKFLKPADGFHYLGTKEIRAIRHGRR